MKTSRRKYNKQYRDKRLYVDGYWNPKIVLYCNEHTRCEECRSHLKLRALQGKPYGALWIYICPTCGKSYGVPEIFEEALETEHEAI